MANPLDLLTLEEARAALSSGTDEQLARYVTAISRRIDDLCGPVVVRTVTDELHDADGGLIFLRHRPVAEITTVTEYLGGTGTVITAETTTVAGGYLLRDGVLARRSGFATSRWNGTVAVTYVAGRYADTATVDAKWKNAAEMILRRLGAREAPGWSPRSPDGYGTGEAGVGFFKVVDPVVNEWLEDELLGPVVA